MVATAPMTATHLDEPRGRFESSSSSSQTDVDVAAFLFFFCLNDLLWRVGSSSHWNAESPPSKPQSSADSRAESLDYNIPASARSDTDMLIDLLVSEREQRHAKEESMPSCEDDSEGEDEEQ